MTKILIVEDDTDINNAVTEYLRARGCDCTQAFSGTEGRLYWQNKPFDLVLADLMLPGLPGDALIREIRAAGNLPVIVLSARSGLEDKVGLLQLGADDYLTKPFALAELWARIEVQLRHAGQGPRQEKNCLLYKEWEIDLDARTLTAAGVPVNLTAHEFDILALLVRRPSKVFTRQEIFEAVWQQDYFVEDKTINVHISNIRAKLRPTGTEGYLQTVWGIGFKLAP